MSFIYYEVQDIDDIEDKTNFCKKCNELTTMYLKLRDCNHTICVKCTLIYLKVFFFIFLSNII